MRAIALIRAGVATALALWLWLSAALAQSVAHTVIDFDAWNTVATRAEATIDLATASDRTLETLRAELVEYRTQFDKGQEQNSARIASLREQIAALGDPPAEGAAPEAADVAAKRAELNEQLSSALVPVQRAEAAFIRADGLISQIDGLLRARQTDALFKVVPTPLNPVYWQPALRDLTSSVNLLRQERPDGDGEEAQPLLQALPLVVGLSALGLLLILRGRQWAMRVVGWLRKLGWRGIGVWSFLASLLRILLPFAGLISLALAATSSGLVGPKGSEIVLTLAFLGGIMLGVRWVSEQVFARDEDDALIALPARSRAEARFWVSLITVMIVMSELIALVLDAGYPVTTSKPVLTLPFFAVSCLALFRLGLILRALRDQIAREPGGEDTALAEVRSSTITRLIHILGTGAVVVAVLSPLLLAAGYFNAADALLPPYIMTLAILGLVMALQRFGADVYGAVTGQGEAARDALLPVLLGMVLLVLAAPLLALIWGMRLTDLTELWSAFGRGFAIGDSRISPGDFLAFAVILIAGLAITRLVQSALRTSVLPKTRLDLGGQNAIVSGVGYIGIFLAAVLAITGAGIDLSSIALVAGALSVGIGFGLQNIVSNFVSGIILLIERPISEGDWIEVGGQMGYVRDISVRSTRIETFDKTDVIVPNADLVSGTVTNYTRGNTVGRVIVPVGVAYGTDTKRVEAILREIAGDQPMVLANPGPNVLFLNFGADALEFEIRCFLRDVNWMMQVKSDINHAIAARFIEEGIEVPFAQRDLWLRNPEVLRGTDAPAEATQSEEQSAAKGDLT